LLQLNSNEFLNIYDVGIIPYSVAFFKLSYKIILILIFGFIKRLVSNLSIVLIKNIIKYTIKRL